MAFIQTISPGDAPEDVARVYRYMAEVGGDDTVARIVQMFSLRAGSMRRVIRTWDLILWHGQEPRDRRELLASLVSRFNDCHY